MHLKSTQMSAFDKEHHLQSTWQLTEEAIVEYPESMKDKAGIRIWFGYLQDGDKRRLFMLSLNETRTTYLAGGVLAVHSENNKTVLPRMKFSLIPQGRMVIQFPTVPQDFLDLIQARTIHPQDYPESLTVKFLEIHQK